MNPENQQNNLEENRNIEDIQEQINPLILESHLENILAEQERQLRQIWSRVERYQDRQEVERNNYILLQRASIRTHHQLRRVRPSPRVHALVIAQQHKNPQEAPQLDEHTVEEPEIQIPGLVIVHI